MTRWFLLAILVAAMAVTWLRMRSRTRALMEATEDDTRHITVAEAVTFVQAMTSYQMLVVGVLAGVVAVSLWWAQDAVEGENELSERVCVTVRDQLEAARSFRSADVRTFELALDKAEAEVSLLIARQNALPAAGLSPAGGVYVGTWIADDLRQARRDVETNERELAERLERQHDINSIPLPEC